MSMASRSDLDLALDHVKALFLGVRDDGLISRDFFDLISKRIIMCSEEERNNIWFVCDPNNDGTIKIDTFVDWLRTGRLPAAIQVDALTAGQIVEKSISADLEGLTFGELKRLAKKEGVGENEIEKADDSNDPMQAIKNSMIKARHDNAQKDTHLQAESEGKRQLGAECEVAEEKFNQSRIQHAATVEKIVDQMRPSSAVLLRCARGLRDIAAGSDECKVVATTSGALDALVFAMLSHPKDVEIQACCTEVFDHLVAGPDECKHAIVAADCVDATVRAMRAHPQQECVLKTCCAFLGNLALAIESGADTGNIVGSLVAQMQSQQQCECVQVHCVGALASIASGPGGCKQALVDANSLETIVATMRAHPRQANILVPCAEVIRTMASGSSQSRQWAIDAGVLDLLLAASRLSHEIKNANVYIEALAMLGDSTVTVGMADEIVGSPLRVGVGALSSRRSSDSHNKQADLTKPDEAIPMEIDLLLKPGAAWNTFNVAARAAFAAVTELGDTEAMNVGLRKLARDLNRNPDCARNRSFSFTQLQNAIGAQASDSVLNDKTSPLRALIAPSRDSWVFVGDYQEFFAAEWLRHSHATDPAQHQLMGKDYLGGVALYLKGTTVEKVTFTLGSRYRRGADQDTENTVLAEAWLRSLFFLFDGEAGDCAGCIPNIRDVAEEVLDVISMNQKGHRKLRFNRKVVGSRLAMASVSMLIRYSLSSNEVDLDFLGGVDDEGLGATPVGAAVALAVSLAPFAIAIIQPTSLAQLTLLNINDADALLQISKLRELVCASDFDSLALRVSHSKPGHETNELADNISALAFAVEVGDEACVSALLRGGSDRMAPDSAGFTPLMRARRKPASVGAAFHRKYFPSKQAINPSTAASQSNDLSKRGSICIDVGTGGSTVYVAFEKGGTMELLQLGETALPPALEAVTMLAKGDDTMAERMCSSIENALLKIMAHETFHDIKFEKAMYGCTSWYRVLNSAQLSQVNNLLTMMQSRVNAVLAGKLNLELQLVKEEVSQADEGFYETLAVEYATQYLTLDRPTAILTGGFGTMRVNGLDTSFSITSNLKAASHEIEKAAADSLIARRRAIDRLRKSIAFELSGCSRRSKSGGALKNILLAQAADAQQGLAQIRLVAVGSFYYAALAAGLISDVQSFTYQPADSVVAKLQQLGEDQTAKPTDVANAVRLETFLLLLFGEPYIRHVHILFMRDAKLGSGSFRATWIAGWWLSGGAKIKELPQPTKPPRWTLAQIKSHTAPGDRLTVSSRATGLQLFVCTVKQVLDCEGLVVARDNPTSDGCDHHADTTLSAAEVETELDIRGAARYVFPRGWRLVVRRGKDIFDAIVEEWLGFQSGNRHKLNIGGSVVLFDINETNHALQRFESNDCFVARQRLYNRHVLSELNMLEDAITGRKLAIEKQLQYIHLSTGVDDIDVDAQTGDKIQGVRSEKVESLSDIRSLVAMILDEAQQDEILTQGGHRSQPVLIRAGPGTGKTWSVQQFTYHVSRTANERDLLLVPLLVYVQRLARFRPKGDASVGSNLLLDYINAEFKDDAQMRDCLVQAFELRQLVLIIDGVDEAAGLKEMIEWFIFNVVLPVGVPLAITSRPEGVRLRYYDHYVILNLAKLTEEQQRSAIKQQVHGNDVFDYLSRFDVIRRTHDEMYMDQLFPQEADRSKLENNKGIDLFFKENGERDPTMRQCNADFKVVAMRASGAVLSNTLKELDIMITPLLAAIDSAVDLGTADEAACALAEHQDLRARTSDSKDDAKTRGKCLRLATSLAALVLKRQGEHKEMESLQLASSSPELAEDQRRKNANMIEKYKRLFAAVPALEAAGLWQSIKAHTDELYVQAEALKEPFEKLMQALFHLCGEGSTLEIASMKDPIRVHEKAWDDYASYFDDGELPEANVLDVFRARICVNGDCKSLLLDPESTMRQVQVEVAGKTYTIRPVRTKNKFRKLDPTHFRNQLHNVEIAADGMRGTFFGELQVHHKGILAYNEESHAHDCYDFFRSLLKNKYAEALDAMLEESMVVFREVSETPVLLSMLVVALDQSDLNRCASDLHKNIAFGVSEMASYGGIELPKDLLELYRIAISKVLHRRMKNDAVQVEAALNMLTRVACANQLRGIEQNASVRTFFNEDVEIALCAALSRAHVGLKVTIKGDHVILDGKDQDFKWAAMSWGRASHSDLTGVIKDVDDRIKGLVVLEDGSTFENPAVQHSEEYELWERLSHDEEGVPLVKTLDVHAGEYQFKHLSFQEALLIHGVFIGQSAVCKGLWATNKATQTSLCTPWLRNSFKLGQGHIGAALSAYRSQWKLGKLDGVGAEALSYVLRGADGLRVLDLVNAKLKPESLAQLADPLKSCNSSLETVAVACEGQLPASFLLAVLAKPLKVLESTDAPLSIDDGARVLEGIASLIETKDNALKVVRLCFSDSFVDTLPRVLAALQNEYCSLEELQLLSSNLKASDERPTLNMEVLVLSTNQHAVIIQDDHDSQPYRLRLDDGTETSDYYTESQVKLIKASSSGLSDNDLQAVAHVLTVMPKPLNKLVIERLELDDVHLKCHTTDDCMLQEKSFTDVQAMVLSHMISLNASMRVLNLSGATGCSSKGIRLIAEGLSKSGSRLAELRLNRLDHTEGQKSIAGPIHTLLQTVCATTGDRVPALQQIDLREQTSNGIMQDAKGRSWMFPDDAASEDPQLLSPLAQLMGMEGNSIRVLRFGSNGTWPEGSISPLLIAMRSNTCILEELDLEGSSLVAADAQALADTVLVCTSLSVLKLGQSVLPLAALRDGTCTDLSFGGTGLSEAEGAVVGSLMKGNAQGGEARTSLSRLDFSLKNNIIIPPQALQFIADGQCTSHGAPLSDLLLTGAGLTSDEHGDALKALLSASPNLTSLDLARSAVKDRTISCITEALAASKASLSKLLAGHMKYDPCENIEPIMTFLDVVCKPGLIVIDLASVAKASGFDNLTGLQLLGPLIELMGTEGNSLRVVRVGGNGAWPSDELSPLRTALRSNTCTLEELDVGGSDLSFADAHAFAEALFACKSLSKVVVLSWVIPVGALRSEAALDIAPISLRLSIADMAIVAFFLRRRIANVEIDIDFSRAVLEESALSALADVAEGILPRGLSVGLAAKCTTADELGALLGSLKPGKARGINCLDISNNDLGEIPYGASGQLANGIEISMLLLDGNPLREDALGPTLSCLKGLRSLSLVGAQLTLKSDSPLVAWFHAQTTLTEIDLSSNQISDDAAPCLAAALKGQNGLRELRIANNALGPSTAEALGSALTANDVIEVLDLANNRIGQGVMHVAAALPTATSLRSADLRSNGIGPSEADVLREALLSATPQLTHVNLLGNAFGTAAAIKLIDALKAKHSLQSLSTSHADAPAEFEDELGGADRILCGCLIADVSMEENADDSTPAVQLVSWGLANMCGHGVAVGRPMVLQFPNGVSISQVACSRHGTLARSNMGEVWYWGTMGVEFKSPTPKRIDELQFVVDIAVTPDGDCCGEIEDPGRLVCAAVTRNGSLYTWGSNQMKEASPSDNAKTIARPAKVQMYGPRRFGKAGGTPQRVALRVACGAGFTIIYSAENLSGDASTVTMFGGNSYISQGLQQAEEGVTKIPELDGMRIKNVVAGTYIAMVMTTDGHVWSWGSPVSPSSANGSRLGRGDPRRSNHVQTPANISLDHLKLEEDSPPPTFVDLNASTHSSVAVTSDGRAISWGDYDCEGLGHKTRPCHVPTEVDISNTSVVHAGIAFTNGVAVTADGSIYTWGGHGDKHEGGIGGGHAPPARLDWDWPKGYNSAGLAISRAHAVIILKKAA